jgi:glycosyltransferase 2 family protein
VRRTSLRRLRSFAARRFRELAAIATALGIAGALWSERKALLDFDWRLAPASFVAAIVLFAVAPFVQAVSFWLMLRLLGLAARLDEALVLWMRSFLLRYAPSGALQLVIRIRQRRRFAASKQDVWLVSGYENLATLCAGAFVCVAAFALAGGWPPLLAVVIAGVALALAVAARPAFFRRWARALLARRGLELPSLLRGRELALVILLNTAGWLTTGGAAYLLVKALVTHPHVGPVWLTAVYSFAWLVGFVVPLLPGGLGLRDGALIALLSTRIGAVPATAVALALRVAATFGELLAIGVTEAVYGGLRLLGWTEPLPATEDAESPGFTPR